ncbi:alpha/beta fold hydrolase [Paenibacillus humicus]|uniref:alpha/beta fold hydrolase n=1 Tax=Paenibacillus humicus TaxID=412861 RepID=UPI003F135429
MKKGYIQARGAAMESTVEHDSYFIDSATKPKRLHVMEWRPSGTARGIIQLSHGMAEHVGRYDSFAREMAHDGYILIGHDHIGHGRSAAAGGLGHMPASGGWQEASMDLQRIALHAKDRFPELPLLLFGHSMGSFLARTCLIDAPDLWQACILSGTAWNPAFALAAGQTLIRLEMMLRGEHARSELLNKIIFGSYNKKFKPNRTRHDWLSVDEGNVDRYMADPYCGFIPSVGFFSSLIATGIPYIQNQKHLAKMNKTMPVYFFSGADDPVGQYGKGVERTFQAFLDAGMRNVTMKLYPDVRHEAIQELNRKEIREDLRLWLSSNL